MVKNNEKIYNLFSNNKFKTLYNTLKKEPKLLNEIINDNKTVIHYAVQTNNKKLVKKLLELDNSLLLIKDSSNYYLPHYSLTVGLKDIFFYLTDKIVDKDNKFINSNDITNKTITEYVLLKNDYNFFDKYFNKYYKSIDWNNDSSAYLFILVNNFPNKLNEINNMIGKIKKLNVNVDNLFKLPKNDNPLFIVYNNYKLKLVKSDEVKEFIKLYPEQLNYLNKNHKPIIYLISENNDLDMLKFCIENGADPNYISPLGYSSFCHYVMSYSSIPIIDYVIDLICDTKKCKNKITDSINHVNHNNESPIFNLLRNYNVNNKAANQKEQQRIISNVLQKTNDWNIQNIYGQTIIHLLVLRPDIEEFYPILKQKYFDINIKNKVGSTPLTLLQSTFKNKKLSDDIINKKITEFKELVIDNYLDTISTLENTKTISKIKEICKNSNKNKTCLNSLNNPLYTNIDKLTKEYQNINLDNYEYAYYNLYNARDVDIYIYYLLLLNKYDILGIPHNNKFDKSKILSTAILENNISPDILNNIAYLNHLINNTTKYSNLYPANIYWLNDNNYILPYNMTDDIENTINDGKQIIILRINIISQILHANILIIDSHNKRIIRFEPQGGITNNNKLDEIISKQFKSVNYFKNYTYFKPSDYMPINGFQSLSQETNNILVRKGDISGFCVAWCLWFTEFYIQNFNNISSDNNFTNIVPKVIKKIINSGNLITEYIRNYANHLHKKYVDYLTKNNFTHNIIYYEHYTDEEMDKLYDFTNKNIINQ